MVARYFVIGGIAAALCALTAHPLPAGKRRIEVTTLFESLKPLSPAEVVLKVDGQEVARMTVKRTVPAAFSASENLRCRHRSRFAGVARLLRPTAVPVRRNNQHRRRAAQMRNVGKKARGAFHAE